MINEKLDLLLAQWDRLNAAQQHALVQAMAQQLTDVLGMLENVRNRAIHPSHEMCGGPLDCCVLCGAFPSQIVEVALPCEQSLKDEIAHCCECGEDYPRSDLLRGHVFCGRCRQLEKQRNASKTGS